MTHNEIANLQQEAFQKGARWMHSRACNSVNFASDVRTAASKLYPRISVTRPRKSVFYSIHDCKYIATIMNEKISVESELNTNTQIFGDVCELAFHIRINRDAFATLEDLIANPTEEVTA